MHSEILEYILSETKKQIGKKDSSKFVTWFHYYLTYHVFDKFSVKYPNAIYSNKVSKNSVTGNIHIELNTFENFLPNRTNILLVTNHGTFERMEIM